MSKLISETGERAAQLSEVKRLQDGLDARGVTFNPYTTARCDDLSAQVAEFEKLLQMRKPLLEAEIEFKKNRGVTAEQYREWEGLFGKFDKDRSGLMEKRELRACVFSLGDELTSAELDRLIAQFGRGGKLTVEQFKSLMVELTGVQDNHGRIMEALRYISRDAPRCPLTTLKRLLPADVVSFIVSSAAPDASGTVDYATWADVVFSR